MLSQFSQKNVLLTMLLLLALGFSLWLTQQSFLKLEGTRVSQSTTPDAFMDQVHHTRYDAEGKWSSRIHAIRLVHYADQDTSLFQSPTLVSRGNDSLSWEVKADHGMAQNGLKTLRLHDNVQVKRLHPVNGVTLRLETSALTAFPQRQFAQTDQPVKITQPGNVVYATGLTADMVTGTIHLLSSVHGSYLHEKKPS